MPAKDTSNGMPNRCYLVWFLTSPVAIAKLLSCRASNLPPSKEGGKADCPPQADANQMDSYDPKAVSLTRQPFIEPCLVPARPD